MVNCVCTFAGKLAMSAPVDLTALVNAGAVRLPLALVAMSLVGLRL